MSSVWWQEPFLALTVHAVGQPGAKARMGTATLLRALAVIYERAVSEGRDRGMHGFVKPPTPGVVAFMVDRDMVLVRNEQGRMKSIHSYSMRAYLRAARAKIERTAEPSTVHGAPPGDSSRRHRT